MKHEKMKQIKGEIWCPLKMINPTLVDKKPDVMVNSTIQSLMSKMDGQQIIPINIGPIPILSIIHVFYNYRAISRTIQCN